MSYPADAALRDLVPYAEYPLTDWVDKKEFAMKLEYARTIGWGIWDAVREFVQNSMDAQEEATGSSRISLVTDSWGLWIKDAGKGFDVDSFFMGATLKDPVVDRGRYGEGMKKAICAALNAGFPVFMWTKDLFVVGSVFERTLIGAAGRPLAVKEVGVAWKLVPSARVGTTVLIGRYREPPPLDRFVFKEDTRLNKVVASDRSLTVKGTVRAVEKTVVEHIIVEPEARLYSKDIFVTTLEDMGFKGKYSYNIWKAEASDDRKHFKEQSEVLHNVGELFFRCVNSTVFKTIFLIFAAYEASKIFEYHVEFPYAVPREEVKAAVVDAWVSTFGAKGVVSGAGLTDVIATRLGYVVVKAPWGWNRFIGYCGVRSSENVSEEWAAKAEVPIEDENLPVHARRRLAVMRYIAEKVCEAKNVKPPSAIRAGKLPYTADTTVSVWGRYHTDTKVILLAYEMLAVAPRQICLQTLIHELGHHLEYDHEDMEDAFYDIMAQVASIIATDYGARRKILLQMKGESAVIPEKAFTDVIRPEIDLSDVQEVVKAADSLEAVAVRLRVQIKHGLLVAMDRFAEATRDWDSHSDFLKWFMGRGYLETRAEDYFDEVWYFSPPLRKWVKLVTVTVKEGKIERVEEHVTPEGLKKLVP